MECPKCNSEVWCLNNTLEGEACYNCIKKFKLKIIPYPLIKFNLNDEFMTKSQFVSKKIKEKQGCFK